jgi:hypothetical protein
MQHTVDRKIVDELRAPEQQVGVFDASNGGSEYRSGHAPTLPRRIGRPGRPLVPAVFLRGVIRTAGHGESPVIANTRSR